MNFLSHFVILILYFVPCSLAQNPTTNYTAYRPGPWCSPSYYMRYPKTGDDVVNIVMEAISLGVTVKAFGIRHSQTDIICTEGIPIDMTGVRSFQMNEDNQTATFGAGVNIYEVGEFLKKFGRSLRTTPAFGNITVGGAIGTGAHGSSIKHTATISDQVVSMWIVNGTGQIQEISSPNDLKAFRLHLGLLGILVNVTLDTVPLFKVNAFNYIVSDDVLESGLLVEWARTADHMTAYWFPTYRQFVIANMTFIDVNTPGTASTNVYSLKTYDSANILLTKSKNVAYDLTSSSCTAASSLGYTILRVVEFILQQSQVTLVPPNVPIYSQNGYTVENPAIGFSHDMLGTICNETSTGYLGVACPFAHGNINANISFIDNEFAIDINNLTDFFKTVKDIVAKTPVAIPLLGMVIRFSGSSDNYMSASYGRNVAYVEILGFKSSDPYNIPMGSLAGYQTIFQTLTKKYKGSSHWGKSGSVHHNSDSLTLKLDPTARANFVAAMNKFDPNEIFINNFGRRLKQTGTKVDIDPLTTRCGLLDDCFCSKNSDCGATQTCTNVPGYTYPVCKTRNEVVGTLPDLSKLLLSDIVTWLNDVTTIDVPLILATCSVSNVLSGVGTALEFLG